VPGRNLWLCPSQRCGSQWSDDHIAHQSGEDNHNRCRWIVLVCRSRERKLHGRDYSASRIHSRLTNPADGERDKLWSDTTRL
jgi:hypothetical protein